MSNFSQVFRNRHAVLPVIHVAAEDQVLRNMEVARASGADGVFLINHGVGYNDLLNFHRSACKHHPNYWIGVNCLDLTPVEIFCAISEQVAGVWVDNARIDERCDHQLDADEIDFARRESCWQGLYFGGVAFKHQRVVRDLEAATRHARRYMDVVTTSGPATGRAADVRKISEMKRFLGDFPLAIASGITPENVGDYLEFADCFLVATGISTSFTELDPQRVHMLVDRVRSYSQT